MVLLDGGWLDVGSGGGGGVVFEIKAHPNLSCREKIRSEYHFELGSVLVMDHSLQVYFKSHCILLKKIFIELSKQQGRHFIYNCNSSLTSTRA